jgi:hypothetical protein
MYGITETTVHVTYRRLSESDIASERSSVVGRGLPDLRIYLLDAHRQPVPIGVAGEIYVGGAGVARGYLNREALTAERFVTDPYSEDAQARLYKTGDVGRWRADGNLEYLGRNDHQVKIRGYRIELGEIESQLQRQPGVREAVVLAREDVPGEKRLVGYVTLHEEDASTVEQLRDQLREVLPEYMVPSAVVVLGSLPLTPSGKLDRKALPAPDEGAFAHAIYEEPLGELETRMAAIWQGLLAVSRVGRHDNFFALGGQSLLAIAAISMVRTEWQIDVPLHVLFVHPTVAELCQYMTSDVSGQINATLLGPVPSSNYDGAYEEGVV